MKKMKINFPISSNYMKLMFTYFISTKSFGEITSTLQEIGL